MRVVAYAARRYAGATRKVIGGRGEVYTCPPITDSTFKNEWLADADLIVFNLHGIKGQPVWMGGDQETPLVPALKATTLAKMDLASARVFALNCHLGDEFAPMRDALAESGAEWLIAGEGVNYGSENWPGGADWLLFLFLHYWKPEEDPEQALDKAKAVIKQFCRITYGKAKQDLLDALRFKIWQLKKS